ncbi:MAG TPA: hypothetical protein VKD69_15795 [Vicinamibacterales bacterium]|nr:hypothetical protein [Vicinamibacterales bacterium]
MTTRPADALVFFGATGDLAYKKIFPALADDCDQRVRESARRAAR